MAECRPLPARGAARLPVRRLAGRAVVPVPRCADAPPGSAADHPEDPGMGRCAPPPYRAAWPAGRLRESLPEAPRESWAAINMALSQGNRGLPGGDTLAQLLLRHRGVRRITYRPRLTIAQILAWADAHHDRTGAWPRKDVRAHRGYARRNLERNARGAAQGPARPARWLHAGNAARTTSWSPSQAARAAVLGPTNPYLGGAVSARDGTMADGVVVRPNTRIARRHLGEGELGAAARLSRDAGRPGAVGTPARPGGSGPPKRGRPDPTAAGPAQTCRLREFSTGPTITSAAKERGRSSIPGRWQAPAGRRG